MTEKNPNAPQTENLPSSGAGAHRKSPDEPIRSRSADPGQSSYGGFSGEDPSRQAQDLEGTGEDAVRKPGK
ncbi:hypothetical protein [Bordetella genomosp. 9]|uniref:Uncharacterized protein n=1 Tax=Bordetella genomosp. 9 TaxID=1416803 RepID=A0A1W6YXD7_9BORD|nr:hypothetical protein [Bordetella genomosp. 9]ARP85765.1 hypothetical protein CAL13_05745 [Bordetella genomosp. 9]